MLDFRPLLSAVKMLMQISIYFETIYFIYFSNVTKIYFQMHLSKKVSFHYIAFVARKVGF